MMNFSVGKKLLIAFIGVALLAVLAGIIGIVTMGSVVKSTDIIIDEKMPMIDSSMEAMLSVETAISESRNYVNKREGLDEIRAEIEEALTTFESHLANIKTRAAGETRALADQATEELNTFRAASIKLMDAHNSKAGYTFSHKGVEYDIKNFFYFIAIEFNKWEAQLEEAATYDVAFTGNMDASKSDFGIWYRGFQTNDTKLAKLLKRYNKLNSQSHKWAGKINAASGEKKLSNFARVKGRQLNKANKELKKIQDYIAPIFDDLASQEKASLSDMEESSHHILEVLEELEGSVDREVNTAKASLTSTQETANYILISTILVSIVASIIIALLSARSITRPLANAVRVANALADGNLGVDIGNIKSRDETGQLLNAMKDMLEKFRKVISEVQSTSNNVASSSEELSASSVQISHSMESQANKANQVATASTEMSHTNQEITKNASEIATSASDTLQIANEGKEVVDKTVTEVKEIERSVSESADLVTTLGERSDQIGQVIEVINDIADQTNLLALNAAIEAARAGEQGRGFAVVADEVRKLAARTTEATKEIGSTIKSIQDETSTVVASTSESLDRVKHGAELSIQAGESLNKIVESANGLQGMIQQIASATEEMTAVTETINKDIEEIATISTETSTGTEGLRQASDDLAKMAMSLKGEVEHFSLGSRVVEDQTRRAEPRTHAKLTVIEGNLPPEKLQEAEEEELSKAQSS